MEFQLYKRHLKTGTISPAYPAWQPMTENEAAAALRSHAGTYQPGFHFFTAPIMKKDNFSRYLKIAAWLRRRYTRGGFLTAQIGRFMSLPAALDYAAARRYLHTA